MTACKSEVSYDFYSRRSLVVRFSELELSSDAGILLARQAEEQVQVCRGLSGCIQEWRDPNKIIHSLHQLVSQRVSQLVGGYEDGNDSNLLRHDPIYKIACERLPIAEQALLASQPSMSRLENHISKREVAAMRSQRVEGFIQRYANTPTEIVLDIDAWDDPTHGNQQLSCFHRYYGQHMYFPVLINEASSGYPLNTVRLSLMPCCE
jgi:hypothetical protein